MEKLVEENLMVRLLVLGVMFSVGIVGFRVSFLLFSFMLVMRIVGW